MPNYSYECSQGHVHLAVRPFGTLSSSCPTCGGEGRIVFVPSSIPTKGPYVKDDPWSRDMHDLHEEVMYEKGEMRKSMEEAVGNGFAR